MTPPRRPRKPPVYQVRITPLDDPTDPRGIRRLRWLLKITLRRLGFRCLGAVEERRSKTPNDETEHLHC